jgi:hypothetical protein
MCERTFERYRALFLEDCVRGFDAFVTSVVAPTATGWNDS